MFPYSKYDQFELGPTPASEEAVQVDPKVLYIQPMKEECKRYAEMLMKRFPDWEKYDTHFKIHRNPYEAGDYYDVVIRFNTEDEHSVEFARFVDDNVPAKWDDDKVLHWTPLLHDFKVTYDDGSSYVTSANGTLEEFDKYLMQDGGVFVSEDPVTGQEIRRTVVRVEEVKQNWGECPACHSEEVARNDGMMQCQKCGCNF